MVTDGRDHGIKVVGGSKHAALDGFEHLRQARIDRLGSVYVRMTQVLNIFRESSKEEDVLLPNFARDFNLDEVSTYAPSTT